MLLGSRLVSIIFLVSWFWDGDMYLGSLLVSVCGINICGREEKREGNRIGYREKLGCDLFLMNLLVSFIEILN